MKKPEVEFIIHDLRAQAEYVCFLAKAIEQGFFQSKGFLVLPYALAKDPLSVYFLLFPYSTEFWRAIGKGKNEDLGKKFPEACIEEVIFHLKKSGLGKSLKADRKIISQWQQREKKFFELSRKFLNFEEILSKLAEIKFLLTDFGTRGSFFVHQTSRGIKITATHRRNFPVAEIGRTLLLSFYFIKKGGAISHLGWEKQQATIDYLFCETVLAKIFPDCQLSKGFLDHQRGEELVAESRTFLSKLGFPVQSIITLDPSGEIIINQKNLTSSFTSQEKTVLQLLIEKRNQLISYDQLAESIWKQKANEKFSLYALAKLIENLRRKFHQAGIYKKIILTVRKKGYLLYD